MIIKTKIKKIALAAFLVSLALLTVLLAACGDEDEYREISFFALDTIINLKVDGSVSSKVAETAEKRISDIDSLLSKTAVGSDTYLANTNIDILIDISDDFAAVCERAIEISDATDGAFDITVGVLKELWETKAADGREPTEAEIENALTYVGTNGISITDGYLEKAYKQTRIDLGGIGKGYAAEEAVKALRDGGAASGILSLGGNIAVFGEKSDGSRYKIALKDPFSPENSLGNILLDEGYVSVSGDYERYIEIGDKKYCHIIDPRTGLPVDNGVHSVAVISRDGVLADALSTALFVMGIDASIDFYETCGYDFEFIMVCDDEVVASRGLEGSFDASRGVTVNYIG